MLNELILGRRRPPRTNCNFRRVFLELSNFSLILAGFYIQTRLKSILTKRNSFPWVGFHLELKRTWDQTINTSDSNCRIVEILTVFIIGISWFFLIRLTNNPDYWSLFVGDSDIDGALVFFISHEASCAV